MAQYPFEITSVNEILDLAGRSESKGNKATREQNHFLSLRHQIQKGPYLIKKNEAFCHV